MVLVDQFEEVFTLCGDEAGRKNFFDTLLHAATIVDGRAIVVLTMRADFYGKCGSYSTLAAAMSDHQILVGPMTQDELRARSSAPPCWPVPNSSRGWSRCWSTTSQASPGLSPCSSSP